MSAEARQREAIETAAAPEGGANTMEARAPSAESPLAGRGALLGAVAGAAMLAFLAVLSWANGADVWLPAREIAAAVFGVESLVGGPPIVGVGIALHLLQSALLGAFLGVFVSRKTPAFVALLGGLALALGTWFFLDHVVLPAFNPVMAERLAVEPTGWLLAHLIFGTMLGALPGRRPAHVEARPSLRKPERHAA